MESGARPREKAWTILEDRAGSQRDVKGETQGKEDIHHPEISSFSDATNCDLDAQAIHVDAESNGIQKELEVLGVSSSDKFPISYLTICGGKLQDAMFDVGQ
jgi:hypothetical protein